MKINEYIESGILEAYVLGSATEAETEQLLQLKAEYPEISAALQTISLDIEHMARQMSIPPPPQVWLNIEDHIAEVVRQQAGESLTVNAPYTRAGGRSGNRKSAQFIEVEAQSGHMRIHKIWRWVFGAVFLLGKIFLAFAIYYYLENRHNEKEIEQLKTELRSQHKS